MSKRGTAFAFEGIDSAGKSTLVKRLLDMLNQEGYPTVSFHFPGKGMNTLGGEVYKIHHGQVSFEKPVPFLSLQTLHAAAHIDLWLNYINKAIEEGKIVLLDRFWWSIYAYGMKQSINEDTLLKLISVEQSCFLSSDVRHYFYMYRPNSADFDSQLDEYYRSLIAKKGFSKQTSFIDNQYEIKDSLPSTLAIILAEIEGHH